jgi:hypothetical protein
VSATSRTRLRHLLILVAMLATTTFAASASPAHAERFAFAFGNDVTNDGNVCVTNCQYARTGFAPAQTNLPTDATVIGNEVFVPDLSGNRVAVYDKNTGAFQRAFGPGVGGESAYTCTTLCGPAYVFGCPNTGYITGCALADQTVLGDAMLGPIASTTANGQLFIAESGRVSIWNPVTGRLVRAFGKDVGGSGIDSCTTGCLPRANGGDGAAELNQAAGLAVSGDELFVSDSVNHRIMVFNMATGKFARAFGKDVGGSGVDACSTTVACHAGTPGNGPGQFGQAGSGRMAIAEGQVFVSDPDNSRILVFDPASGAPLRTIGGTPGSAAGELLAPLGIAIAGTELFVADVPNHRISVFDTATGRFLRAVGKDVGGAGTGSCTTSCQSGAAITGNDPTAAAAVHDVNELSTPFGLSVDGGRLYIADTQLFGGRLEVLDASTGAPIFTAGYNVQRGEGNGFERCRIFCQSGNFGFGSGHLTGPTGTAAFGGRLFVSDGLNRVNVYDTATGSFVRAFGTGVGGAGHDTCTTSCTVGAADENGSGSPRTPFGIAVDATRVFVGEQNSDRISVFSPTTGAFMRAFGKDVGGAGVNTCAAPASSCHVGTQGDGAGQLHSPGGLAVSGDDLFVADAVNNRISVFSASTGDFVRAFGKDVGGSGINTCTSECHSGAFETGAGALRDPEGVAVAGGEVFVVEVKNSRVSVFNAASGAFLRAYGANVGGSLGVNTCTDPCTRGTSGDGTGSGAGLFNPIAVAVANGELFVADEGFSRVTVYNAATGLFLRAFGKDVGGPGHDTCTVPCATGGGGGGGIAAALPTDGNNAGRIDVPFGIAVAGDAIFVTDVLNFRVAVWSKSTDVTAPNTTITAGPSAPTNDNTPTFSFTADDVTATFECKIDSRGWNDCTSALTTSTLADGPHTLQVRALDAAWNVDTTPASRSFTVDTTPPETTITGVTGPVNNKLTFAFTASETGSTFQCKLDNGSFASCGSPFTTGALSSGSHTFQVRAADALGNTDQTPAIKTVGPPTLTAAPTNSPDYVLKATLTFGNTPLANQTITFSAGGTALCTAATGTNGVATCSVSTKPKISAINNARGYTATFTATGPYLGATANGALGGAKK